MSFDKPTRNALARMVGRIRERLAEDIAAQLQTDFRLQPDGTTLPLDGLTEDQRAAAQDLRQLLDHYAASLPQAPQSAGGFTAACERLVREIGFTVLNRLAALRLCEERGLVVECVRNGMASDGFLLFDRLTGGALGSRYTTYRAFLENQFDELALDLGVLFDRHSPLSHVFPTERVLEDVLDRLNDPALAHLWREDETIGWVYQYYNDEAERKQMREESQAPRNSRELAVRNQFFTPRYVVEFLTDNTLGRLWYEMRRGETALAEKCRYLVRRKHPIFLQPGEEPPECFSPSALNMGDPDLPGEMWMRPNPAIEDISSIFHYALTVGGYDYAREHWSIECADLANERLRRYGESGHWEGTFEELRCCLFFEQRRYHHFGQGPEGEDEAAIKELYKAICQRWDLEVGVVSHRSKKDPREIKMLDPAGGSGHFGLYCFDLFETIYAEAYDDPDLGPALQTNYPDRATFLREVPRLILAHNLHVIDIDPRACQIAALALWLRAQRSWQGMGLKPGERPRIRKANVVCAEPMPGERDLLEEFVAALDPPELGELVRFVFERMQLAGEAGSLLKIEEELREKIEKLKMKTGPLFAQGDFWDRAEPAVLQALKHYAEHIANGLATRRQLFADDAAQGFAFIDLCRQRYDVVLMNPPFGDFSRKYRTEAKATYPNTYNDIFAAFVERFVDKLEFRGELGVITSRNGFFLRSFVRWRQEVLLKKTALHCLTDLGSEVMDDAMVEAAAYCLSRPESVSTTLFFRLLGLPDREDALYRALEALRAGLDNPAMFITSQQQFEALPGAPFVYWIPAQVLRTFSALPKLEPTVAEVRQGLVTGDNFRFVRTVWEVPQICWLVTKATQTALERLDGQWAFLVMKGASQPWYSPITVMVNWKDNGAELRNFVDAKGKRRSRPQNIAYYFRPGFSWTRRAVRFIPYIIPAGCIPTASRYMAFPRAGYEYIVIGLVASNVASAFLRFYGENFERPNYLVEDVKALPVPTPTTELASRFAVCIRLEFQRRQRAYQNHEPFYEFTAPVLCFPNPDVDALAFDRRSLLGPDLEAAVAHEYGFGATEQTSLERDLRESILAQHYANSSDDDDNDDDGDGRDFVISDTSYDRQESMLSYAVGCVFGRWDIRLALDLTLAPKLQDPFDPLPVCPPGMLVGPDGLPATPGHIVSEEWLRARPNAIALPPTGLFDDRPPTADATRNTQHASRPSAAIPDSAYPLHIAWDGILVDDPGLDDRAEHPHPADVVRRVREVLAVLWGERAEAIEAEACEILGVPSLRDYFRRPSGFFADHLKRYSKSRRQAPIYWPLSTASGRYTVWLYYHRLTQDTLYTVVNQYVTPKLDEVQKRIDLLTGRSDLAGLGRPARSAAELRDQLNDLKGFQSELADFRTELLRVAALPYKPNLNDGVIINAAPLHRLFRLRKWANDTATVWKKLEAGEYDWAHLAYTLWPERVKQVCETDRSIAIAHGLEHLCSVEVKQAKRKGRKKAESETETMGIGSEDE